ncbi:MAG: helix-turn-helix domain-containing protein [Armatimonadota bacterium]
MTDSAILTADQLKCLASPVRNDVFVAIRTLGQASAADIAKARGLSPETVHFHLKGLAKVNLIKPCGHRPTARRPEELFETTAPSYRLPDTTGDPDLASIVRNTVSSGIRRAIRGYEKAAKSPEGKAKATDGFQVIQARIRLSPDDQREFMALIEQAVQFAKERECSNGIPLNWTSLVFPEGAKSIAPSEDN